MSSLQPCSRPCASAGRIRRGFAVYGPAHKGKAKITLQSPDPDRDFAGLTAAISKAIGADVSLERKSTHGVLTVPADKAGGGARGAAHAAIRSCAS